jgi:hypothetical protein
MKAFVTSTLDQIESKSKHPSQTSKNGKVQERNIKHEEINFLILLPNNLKFFSSTGLGLLLYDLKFHFKIKKIKR